MANNAFSCAANSRVIKNQAAESDFLQTSLFHICQTLSVAVLPSPHIVRRILTQVERLLKFACQSASISGKSEYDLPARMIKLSEEVKLENPAT